MCSWGFLLNYWIVKTYFGDQKHKIIKFHKFIILFSDIFLTFLSHGMKFNLPPLCSKFYFFIIIFYQTFCFLFFYFVVVINRKLCSSYFLFVVVWTCNRVWCWRTEFYNKYNIGTDVVPRWISLWMRNWLSLDDIKNIFHINLVRLDAHVC